MSAERIRIPDILGRPTDHALICTFGADLSFYEGPLWRQVSHARNRIVLADDRMLARHLTDQAVGGSQLRHINMNYLVSPIANPGSAHAKLILLADSTSGTLLVGSGNLGRNGYASLGEIFRRYDLGPTDTSQLAAFLSAKEFLDLLSLHGHLDEQARRHIDQIWADLPWIWLTPPDPQSPVRHNLASPLAEQLVDVLNGEPVIDLVAHAPFYDPECEAFRRLMIELSPANTTVLLQEHRTCVDPAALSRALTACPTRPNVLLAEAPDSGGTYLHAKFLLIRTETRSISFAGSANLSLAALFRTDQATTARPAGNVELVNLYVGEPADYDELLTGLSLKAPEVAMTALNLRDPRAESEDSVVGRPQLLRGTWERGLLSLDAAAELPDGRATLVVAGRDISVEVTVRGSFARAPVGGEAGERLSQSPPVPVWLRIDVPAGPVESTAVYPYHPALLAGMLAGRRDPELLHKSGSLDLEDDDPDLAAVVAELEAALVIDRESLWRLAPKKVSTSVEGTEGPHLLWTDLDWERLRRHPRLAQYESATIPTEAAVVTDLQIVLGSIMERIHGFGGLHAVAPSSSAASQPIQSMEFDVDSEIEAVSADLDPTRSGATTDEVESESDSNAEALRRRAQQRAANRGAWQRFCDRLADGLEDADFIELVGPGVVVANAILLNHLLALLIGKETIDSHRGMELQVELWRFLFGDDTVDGYLAGLDEETRLAALGRIEEHGGETVLFSSMGLAEQLTRSGNDEDLRVELRILWRHILEDDLVTFTADVIKRAIVPAVPTATQLARALDRFVHEWTLADLKASVATVVGPDLYLTWTKATVHRNDRNEPVEVLEIDASPGEFDPATARLVLAAWARVDRDRDYFRVRDQRRGAVAAWDRPAESCWWYDSQTGDEETLAEPHVIWPTWSIESERLIHTARLVDETT